MILGAKGTGRNFFEEETVSDNRQGFDFKVKVIKDLLECMKFKI